MTYCNDTTFRLNIKCLICLIFVQRGYYDNLYISIRNRILERNTNIGLQTFFNYFEANWVKKVWLDDLELYNRIQNRISFTNNHAEGFNSALSREIRAGNPNLIEVIESLRTLDYIKETDIFAVKINEVNVYRRFETEDYR